MFILLSQYCYRSKGNVRKVQGVPERNALLNYKYRQNLKAFTFCRCEVD